MPSGNKPCMTLSAAGGVQLSIWKNRNADGNEWYSCKPSRRFKRKGSTEFETSESFGARDLMQLSLLCEEAARRISIREFGDLNRPASMVGDESQVTDEAPSDEDRPF